MGRAPARPSPIPGDTRGHLLHAAAREFAARGFRDATVRTICRGAGANVAAVHYHFGDKAGLYAAVLRETGGTAGDPPLPPPAIQSLPAPRRLEWFVRSLLGRILTEGPGALHGQILAREMIDPTPALDQVVADFIRPQSEWLNAVIRELLGPGLPPRQVRRFGLSVVSQILFYKHCRPVLARLYPDEIPGPGRIGVLTRHITTFSLAALQELARQRRHPASRALTP